MKNNLFNFIKGLCYGIFSISPGLSGGVLATYFGDYDRVLNIIIDKKIDRSRLIYLLILMLGFISGTILFANIILNIYINFTCLFKIIIIILNIYILFCMIKHYDYLKIIFIFIVSLALYIILIKCRFNFVHLNTSLKYSFGGVIYSIGKIVPGISSTTLLINVGIYEMIINFYASPINYFFANLKSWFLFWGSFSVTSIILLFLLIKFKNNIDIKVIVIIIMILNILFLK